MSAYEWMIRGGLAVGALVGVGVLVHVLIGLFQARSLIRRELTSYFVSPIAYVVFTVFLFVTGLLFGTTLDQLTTTGPEGVEYPLRFMFGDERFWLIFLFIPPLITMRSFAEERATGTLEVLMTAPLRDWQLVLSKFAGCLGFYVLLWVPTLLYVGVLFDLRVEAVNLVTTLPALLCLTGLGACLLGAVMLFPRFDTPLRLASVLLVALGFAAAVGGGILHAREHGEHLVEVSWGIDPAPALTFYLGVLLAGAMFLALGLLISSLVRDQLVSAIVALVIALPFVAVAFFKRNLDADTTLDRLVYFFSVPLHFSSTFTRGLLDSRPLILYASATLFCLFLTVRGLESRRWR